MRRNGRSIVTRTEATAQGFNAELNWPGDGWGLWHPRAGAGHDCSVEWDKGVWTLLDKGILPLTDIEIRTEKGFRLEPCALTWAVLGHKHSGVELEVGAAHLDLDSNERRRAANRESCNTLRAHYVSDAKRHPHRRHLLQMDGNRDQRNLRWRTYFRTELMTGTKMASGWGGPLPKDGTHGKALLDLAVADFPIHSRLLADDPSSDHRPFESGGRL